jgi:hypothetical protein
MFHDREVPVCIPASVLSYPSNRGTPYYGNVIARALFFSFLHLEQASRLLNPPKGPKGIGKGRKKGKGKKKKLNSNNNNYNRICKLHFEPFPGLQFPCEHVLYVCMSTLTL